MKQSKLFNGKSSLCGIFMGCAASLFSTNAQAQDCNGRVLSGHASYYGQPFHGRTTANGETFNMHAMTAAHKTLPFGTLVEVSLAGTDESVVVRINDRGPFIAGRTIDLSQGAAQRLGMIDQGVARVRLQLCAS